jgi:hypothetical protein
MLRRAVVAGVPILVNGFELIETLRKVSKASGTRAREPVASVQSLSPSVACQGRPEPHQRLPRYGSVCVAPGRARSGEQPS